MGFTRRSWCVRNPSFTYAGPPPVSLAVKLEALATEVRDVSEDDADLALSMAKSVREEAKQAEAERVKREKAEAAAAREEAAREAARAREQQRARDLQASDVRSPEEAAADAARVSRADFASRRARATEVAAHLPTLFDFAALPDEVAGAVMRRMGDYEVAAISCASRRWRDLAATDDALWEGLQLRARRHPSWRVDGTWKTSFLTGTHEVDAQWRRGRFQRKDYRAHSEFAQCVAMWGDVGATGSADHTLALLGLPPRGRPEPPARRPGGWERVLARCVGHAEAVTCCKLLGDGNGDSAEARAPATMISTTARGELRVWDLRGVGLDPWEAREEGTLEDGAGSTRETKIGCVATKRLTTPDTGQPHSQFFDVSADGGLLASAGDAPGAGVHVYDTSRWGSAVRRMPGFDAGVYGVAFDRDVVHAACSDGVVRRWDVRSPARADTRADTCLRADGQTTIGPRDASTGLARGGAARCVAADDGLFAFGTASGTVHVHDARKPSVPLASPRRVHSDCVNCVSMSARLRRVVTGGDDCSIAVTRLPLSLEEATPAHVSTPLGVMSVAFDHSRMIAGCEDSTVRVWDAVLGDGYVDRDALKAAMSMINQRFRGNGSMAQPQTGGQGDEGARGETTGSAV